MCSSNVVESIIISSRKNSMYFLQMEGNILSINPVKTNGRFFNPNIHVVGEKSPIIVGIIAIC